MPRESWEIAHDSYYDDLESDHYDGLDDSEAWKEEEQKVIDDLIKRMQGAYNGTL